MWIYDVEIQKTVAVNREMRELLGFASEERCCRMLCELLQPEVTRLVVEAASGAKETHLPGVELTSIGNGAIRLDLSIRPFYPSTDSGAMAVVCGRRPSIQRDSVPIGSVAAPVCITRRDDGRIVYANSSFADLAGIDISAIAGRSAMELGLVGSDELRGRMLERLAMGEAVQNWETVIERPDGARVPVAVFARMIDMDASPCLVSTLFDRSDQLATENRVKNSLRKETAARSRYEELNRRLSFLLDASAILTEHLDYEARLRRLAEIAVPTIADWCTLDMLDDDGLLNRVAAVHSDPAKTSLAFEVERRYPARPNARRGPYRVMGSGQPDFYETVPDELLEEIAVDDEHLRLMRDFGLRSIVIVPLITRGRAIGVLTLGMGESGRHFTRQDLEFAQELARRASLYIENARLYADMERAVRDRTEELEAVNNELQAFSYSVSHDLRAPLRHLTGFVRMLDATSRDALDKRAAHYLDTIIESAQRMEALIHDLLAFSRIGRVELKMIPTNLEEVVRRIADEVADGYPRRRIDWKIDSLPVLVCDRAMIEQVFRNLIGNAVKFTATRERAVVEVGSSLEGAESIFFVRDNGAGFDPAYKDKLFEVFQRLHSRDEFEGTGIGLANVRRIVERHGGRVWAEGAVEQGATVSFSLPSRRGEGH